MKRARFTEEQIVGVLKQSEAGMKTVDLSADRTGIAKPVSAEPGFALVALGGPETGFWEMDCPPTLLDGHGQDSAQAVSHPSQNGSGAKFVRGLYVFEFLEPSD